MKSFVISLAIALGLIIPAAAFAQSSSTGLLTVYVQVTNPSTYYGVQPASPSNFTVQVSGQNPSPSSFTGSQSGTSVSLNPGAYNVSVSNSVPGYAPTYSTGCNN